jgi:hypothetical protein
VEGIRVSLDAVVSNTNVDVRALSSTPPGSVACLCGLQTGGVAPLHHRLPSPTPLGSFYALTKYRIDP